MRFRFAQLCVTVAMCSTVLTGSAFAQAAPDDSSAAAPATADPVAPVAEDKDAVEWGVGVRLRNVRIPQGELELFLERAAGGSSNFGIGFDVTRRRGSVELQMGLEYEHISPGEGVWIESGKNVAAGDEADYVLGPDRGSNLGWLTLEFTFFNHVPINKHIAFRYGFGGGIGIITGNLKRIDVLCNGATNSNVEPGCVPPAFGGTATETQGGTPQNYDLKTPIFPVINMIAGLQWKPVPKATVNFELGIRTLLFIGFSGSYFF
jgi:hypothetical protein